MSVEVADRPVVRPDQVTLGVLVSRVPRDAVDDAVAVCGVREKRSDGKLPAHVTAYLTLGLALFPDEDYTEVVTRVTGSLDRFGCWDAAWTVPTSSAITQARKRLGRKVFAELFERTGGPVAGVAGVTAREAALGTARGSFLRRWRLLAIDGFEIDVPDSVENAAEFGYAGSGLRRISRADPCSDTRPFSSTSTSSAMFATTPRSWVMNRSARPSSRWNSASSASTDACTEASRAEVISSQTMTAGSAAGPARCRSAASRHPRARRDSGGPHAGGTADRRTDGLPGIQRVRGVLEHDLDAPALFETALASHGRKHIGCG